MTHAMRDAPDDRPDPSAGPSTASWPDHLRRELDANRDNGCVGTELVSETERARIWLIRLKPGERIGFHRHVNDYWWTAINAGRARSRNGDGGTVETEYFAGETRHARYAAGESKLHDLENIGDTELVFSTVELLGGANPALPIPDAVRLATPPASR